MFAPKSVVDSMSKKISKAIRKMTTEQSCIYCRQLVN